MGPLATAHGQGLPTRACILPPTPVCTMLNLLPSSTPVNFLGGKCRGRGEYNGGDSRAVKSYAVQDDTIWSLSTGTRAVEITGSWHSISLNTKLRYSAVMSGNSGVRNTVGTMLSV